MPAFHPGQTVSYKPVGGRRFYAASRFSHSRLNVHLGPNSNTSTSTGIIRDVATEPAALTGRSVTASEHMPRYQVRTNLHVDFPGVGVDYDLGTQIENLKTRKSSAVKECNIIGPAE